MFQLQNSNTILLQMRSRQIHGIFLIWKIIEAVKPMKKIGYATQFDSFNSEQKWEKLFDERKQERKQLFQRQNFILLIGLLREL